MKIGLVAKRGVHAGSAGFLFLWILHFPMEARAQDAGAALFKLKCAVCHGEGGDANTGVGRGVKLRDLRSSAVQKQTDAQLFTITHCGKGKMPSSEGQLTDAQVTQLVRYIRSLGAK